MVSGIKRKTVQRTLTLEAVRTLCNHPTAEDVYSLIRKSYPNISLGTVYRNLSSLCHEGELRHIKMPDAADRYDHNLSAHYHIECRVCGAISDVFIPYVEKTDVLASESSGFSDVSHDIVFYGVCPECQNK